MFIFKSILKKLIVLSMPIIALEILSVAPTTRNLFLFRAWEELATYHHDWFYGPFYPRRISDRLNAGDQVPQGPRTKRILFRTDEYGFRNDAFADTVWDAVVIGSSQIVGSYSSQEHTITNRIFSSCNVHAYNYGHGTNEGLSKYFFDRRFLEKPPKFLIVEARRGLLELWDVFPDPYTLEKPFEHFVTKWFGYANGDSTGLSAAAIETVDHFSKHAGYQFVRSRLGTAFTRVPYATSARTYTSEELLKHHTNRLLKINEWLKMRGSHLIFVLLPYHLYRDKDQLISNLEANGIQTLPYLPSSVNKDGYPTAAGEKDFYFPDDSHWQEWAIDDAAKKLCSMMER